MCLGALVAKKAMSVAGPAGALISPLAAIMLKKKMSGSAPMSSGPAGYASSSNNNLPIPPKLGA